MSNNNIISKLALSTTMILSLFLITNVDAQVRKSKKVTVVRVQKTPRSKVVYVDRKRSVKTVVRLPKRARIVHHNGIAYHYDNGVYYRYKSGRYVIVNPPRGVKVGKLPNSFRVMSLQGISFYYSDGIYYKKRDGLYEIVSPKAGLIVQDLPDSAEKVSIDNKIYYEYADTIYRLVETENGLAYEVAGEIG